MGQPAGAARLAGLVGLALAETAGADCRLELELLGRDLKGVALTEVQRLTLAPLVDDAIKRCRLGREREAEAYFQKARAVAGIQRPADDLDEPSGQGNPR
ncbi:MAG: hypothetical protein ING70_08065 [Rhodocyclaceae bacterium]|jgi:hypothetical protein|nr:hypothetical protein [Rhodocyclaceae bacterium]MCA3145601.1 hypothetical protein [Rhodocyclaceae bacterium]